MMGRPADGIGQGLELLRAQLGLIGTVIKNLKGCDFVLVVFDKLFEGINNAPGFFQGNGIEARLDNLVLTDMINGLLGLFLELHQQGPQFRIVKGLNGLLDQLGRRILYMLLVGRIGFGVLRFDFFQMKIRVQRIDQIRRKRFGEFSLLAVSMTLA